MINGMAGLPISMSNNTAQARKVNLNLFFSQEKSLNLNASISIRETSRSEKTIVIEISTQSCMINAPILPVTNGSAVIKMVLSGVFKTLNESCCVSSTLKIARRSAEHNAIINPPYIQYYLLV